MKFMDRFYDSSIKDSSEVWVQDEKYVAFVNSDSNIAKFVEKTTSPDLWENSSQATTPQSQNSPKSLDSP
jgi:hypothetical protein